MSARPLRNRSAVRFTLVSPAQVWLLDARNSVNKDLWLSALSDWSRRRRADLQAERVRNAKEYSGVPFASNLRCVRRVSAVDCADVPFFARAVMELFLRETRSMNKAIRPLFSAV